MASLGPKKVGADKVLGPDFLVSFTVSSFSIDRQIYIYIYIYIFFFYNKCVTQERKIKIKCVKIWASSGVNWDQRSPNRHSLPCNSDWSQAQQHFKVAKPFNKNRYKTVLVGSQNIIFCLIQSQFNVYCLNSATKNYLTKGLRFHPCTETSIN